MLTVFSGLPGTGKTTLALAIARVRGAAYLRIDTIEHALSGGAPHTGPEGYLVAYAVAQDNLRLGLSVVADCVNPLAITRQAWRDAAAAAGVPVIEVEITCSDAAEHRERIERRAVPPTWAMVLEHDYERWDRPHVTLDTAGRTVSQSSAELERRIAGWAASRLGGVRTLAEAAMGELVIVTYRPKPGREAELASLVREHVPLLRALDLATDRAPVAMRAKDGSIIEVFEWRAGASDRAHTIPEVRSLWQRFDAACTFATLRDVAESADPFAAFEPLDA